MAIFYLKDMKCAYSEDGRVVVPFALDKSKRNRVGYWAYPTDGNSSMFVDTIDENVVVKLIAKVNHVSDDELNVISVPDMIKEIGVDKIRGATFYELRKRISIGRTSNAHEDESVIVDNYCSATQGSYKIIKLITDQYRLKLLTEQSRRLLDKRMVEGIGTEDFDM